MPLSTPTARKPRELKENGGGKVRCSSASKLKNYEFNAPQYYNFNDSTPGERRDSWFDQSHSPLTTAISVCGENEGTEVEIPASVTQFRKRVLSSDQSLSNDPRDSFCRTNNKNNDSTVLQSPSVVETEKRSSANVFQNEKRKKSDEGEHHYEDIFEIVKADKPRKNLSPKFGRIRTPDKAKIARLKTSGPLLPARSTKPLTIPQEFSFSDRSHPKKQSSDMKQTDNGPKSGSLILKKSAHSLNQITIPQSPMLLTKIRSKSIPYPTQENNPPKENKNIVAADSVSNKSKITVPVEFNFALLQHKRENITKSVRSTSPFKVTQIKNETDSAGKTEKIKGLTKPKPFQLQSDLRYKLHHERFQKRLEEEEKELRLSREFQAHPVPHTAPFCPKKSTKPLTQLEEVELHSSERAEKRKEFDDALRRKQEEMEQRRILQEALNKQRDEEEIKKMRKELIPKANPIRQYSKVDIHPSDKPLTVPKSPALQTNLRVNRQR